MAKQSISIVERHVEKGVVGLAGLIFLAMVWFYVLGSPNGVELPNGEKVAPTAIGAELNRRATEARQVIVNHQPEKTSPGTDYLAWIQKSRVLSMDPSLTRPTPAWPTALNPAPPTVKLDYKTMYGKTRLATILPPGRPVVFQGRNRATLPEPVAIGGTPGAEGGAAAARDLPTGEVDAESVKEVSWVTVAAPVFRSKQLDEFASAGYSSQRMDLLITAVRLERQTLQSDGTWSERAEAVEGFSRHRPLSIPTTVELVQDTSGWGVKDLNVEQILGMVKDSATRTEIWRPSLAPYLDATTWPPRNAPELEDVVWEDWVGTERAGGAFRGPPAAIMVSADGVAVAPPRTPKEPTPKPERPVRTEKTTKTEKKSTKSSKVPTADKTTKKEPARPAAGAADKATRDAARARAVEGLKQAKTAADARRYEEAERLLSEVLAIESLPEDLETQAEALAEKIAPELEAALAKAAARGRRQREGDPGANVTADVEPLWIHDLTVEPGATYRYRVQCVVYNTYVGLPDELANGEQDARKLLLTSDWSSWSEPVTVRPTSYVFFTRSVSPADKTVSVDVYAWSGGLWRPVPGKKVEVGQRIAFDYEVRPASGRLKKKVSVDTGLTVVDIDYSARRPVRARVRKDGGYDFEVRETQVLVLADAQGRVRERVNQDEKNNPERLGLLQEIEEEAQPSESGGTPGMMPGPRVPPGGVPGRRTPPGLTGVRD